ncbi:MAG TPA: hypothetical protein PKH39_19270 [Woeseiaceae bacterium]|nr:hypothetical protein [Woeseiaceae bacterium]
MAFDTEEDLENAIDILQQTHTVHFPNMATPATLTDHEQIPTVIQQMTSRYEDCSGVDLKHETETTDWLKVAAERRVPIAMIEYANQIADPQEAIAWFEGAWIEGDAEGLLYMSNVYFDNYYNGRNPGDNVNGYAALLTYTLLVDAGMGGSDHGAVAHRQVQRVKDQLEQAKESLRQYELDEAAVLASKLISSNPNCCFGM